MPIILIDKFRLILDTNTHLMHCALTIPIYLQVSRYLVLSQTSGPLNLFFPLLEVGRSSWWVVKNGLRIQASLDWYLETSTSSLY